MPAICPECGGFNQDGLSCQSIFNNFIALEFADPEYGAVHFLTVACYMIQHGRYSDEGLEWIEKKLRDHLEHGLAVDEIRASASAEADQSVREWKVIRQPNQPSQMKINWSMTINDVAGNYRDAVSYQDLIQKWARPILNEMSPLV